VAEHPSEKKKIFPGKKNQNGAWRGIGKGREKRRGGKARENSSMTKTQKRGKNREGPIVSRQKDYARTIMKKGVIGRNGLPVKRGRGKSPQLEAKGK